MRTGTAQVELTSVASITRMCLGLYCITELYLTELGDASVAMLPESLADVTAVSLGLPNRCEGLGVGLAAYNQRCTTEGFIAPVSGRLSLAPL
jgi:hypothetical protein